MEYIEGYYPPKNIVSPVSGFKIYNWTGITRFHLTAIKPIKNEDYGNKFHKSLIWEFSCDCGGTVFTPAAYVFTCEEKKATKSCGCDKSWTRVGKDSNHFQGYGEVSKRYFSSVKNRAIKKNLEFNLTIEDFWNLFLKQNRKCSLTGIELILSNNHNIVTASLDRIDNTKGYIIENVQWVHKDINFMKGTLSSERFIELCKKVSSKCG